MAVTDVIKRLIYQFTSTGADKVADDIGKVNTEQTKLAASTPQVTKASLDLSKSFENLERRFDSTIRAQQDYQKVQDKVNAAVAQNPALQERANSVLAKAAEHFDRAGKSTTAYAGAVDVARNSAMGLAAGIGPLGAVLGSFGPLGIAAAAGISLITSAVTYLRETAAKAGDEAVKLKQFSDIAGLTTTQVRGLSEAGQELGIGSDAVNSALQKLTFNLDATRKGSGDLYDNLRQIDQQLADQVAMTRSGSEAIDVLAKAYNSLEDATEKAALARAAFGKAGAEVGPMLRLIDEANGVEQYSQAASKALGVTEEWTREIARLRNANKDLADDIKTVEASMTSRATLKAENVALEAQLSTLKKTRDALWEAEGGTKKLTEATAAHTAAANASTAANRNQAASLDLIASKSARNVSALGSAATPQERGQSRIDQLYTLGLSPDILARAVQGVRDDTEKAAAAMQKYDAAAEGAKNTLGDLMRKNQSVAKDTEDASKSIKKLSDSTQEASGYAGTLASHMAEVENSAYAAANGVDRLAEAANEAMLAMAKAAGSADAMAFGPSQTDAVFGGSTVSGGNQYTVDKNTGAMALLRNQAEQERLAEAAGVPGTYGATGAMQALYGRSGFDLEKILGPQRVVKDLTKSIDTLTNSTDSLNATNQELLSPYYTTDPRTSHIGFRSQGMAAGGYVDVPGGYSANDNMLAMVPVASGERIYVDPNTTKRGGAGGQVITINAPVSIYGSAANKDDIGRSVYQNAQAAARQIAMASR